MYNPKKKEKRKNKLQLATWHLSKKKESRGHVDGEILHHKHQTLEIDLAKEESNESGQ